jgi:hypothetical protein
MNLSEIGSWTPLPRPYLGGANDGCVPFWELG